MPPAGWYRFFSFAQTLSVLHISDSNTTILLDDTVSLNAMTSITPLSALVLYLPHNLAPFCLLASFSLSLNSLLRIFPLGLFGITSINSTPPFNHLCRALFFSTCFWISSLMSASLSSRCTDCDLTTYALGSSPASSSGTGITVQSATAG